LLVNEENRLDKLENIFTSNFDFHTIWLLQKTIIEEFDGSASTQGSLKNLKTKIGRKNFKLDGDFSANDEFLLHVFHALLKAHDENGKSTLDIATSPPGSLTQLLLMYFEYRDAVRSGDGIRVLKMLKMLTPLWIGTDKHNYAAESVIFLANIYSDWSDMQVSMAIHQRFANVSGIPGHYKPLDQLNENINLNIKEATKGLGN